MEEERTNAPNLVVSLLIERSDNPDLLLMGVREPVHNPRHPGVLSTITQRLPPSFAAMLTAPAQPDAPLGVQRSGTMFSAYIAESAMARKLGVGQLLEEGRIQGRVNLVCDVTDLVDDPLGTQISELTRMVTFRVLLTSGADLIPSCNASYVQLAWVETMKLTSALAQHDALILIPDADPFMVCIHGLCVRSAAAVLCPSA